MPQRRQLEITVWGRAVGVLEQVDVQRHVFTYLPDVPDTHFVSLTMPVRAESYVWERGLHPIFQMNLPEGYRKDLIRERLGPLATVDDYSLLALTGATTLGRIGAVPLERERGTRPDQHDSIASILAHQDSRQALLQYLSDTVLDGISGVMPKALASDERVTLRTPGWILKTGREDTPGLCINEYVCLNLARTIGLPTPEAKLSEDGNVLAVARFDVSRDDHRLGLEDMCALLGLAPSQKYEATAEQIVRALLAFVADAEKIGSSKRFVGMLLLNAAIRNADAHAKNYALVYSSIDNVTLAPVYDIITVHAYASYAKNPYAILVGGTKSWSLRKQIERIATERLSLDMSFVRDCIDRLHSGMKSQVKEIESMATNFPQFREPAKAMLRSWTQGLSALIGKRENVIVDVTSTKLSEKRKSRKTRSARKYMNPERFE